MKTVISIIAAILFLNCSSNQENKTLSAEAKSQIEQAFKGYQTNITTQNAEAAYNFLSVETKEYYNSLFTHTLYSDSQTLLNLPLLSSATILHFKARVPGNIIQNMTAETFYSTGLKIGVIGDQSIQSLKLGQNKQVGDVVKFKVVAGLDTLPIHFNFVEEKGSWKIDLQEISNFTEQTITEALKEEQIDKLQFLQSYVVESTKRGFDPEILNPIIKK